LRADASKEGAAAGGGFSPRRHGADTIAGARFQARRTIAVTAPIPDNNAMQANVDPQPSRFRQPPGEPIDLERTALLLDVDGTILDIAATPDSVVVPAPLVETLGALHRRAGGALALVSGRLIDNLDRLFAPLRLPAIGAHGLESRYSGAGDIVRNSGSMLGTALKERLTALAARDRGILAEDKGTSLALHYRLAPMQREFLDREAAAIVAREPPGEIEIIRGKSVIEIKVAQSNKGIAVAAMMRVPPFARRAPLFVGDDTTDLSVFAMLERLGGRGYAVGCEVAGTDGTFATPRDVRGWLASLGRDGSAP
jgi:trehalose 6-phosphate phosphatase